MGVSYSVCLGILYRQGVELSFHETPSNVILHSRITMVNMCLKIQSVNGGNAVLIHESSFVYNESENSLILTIIQFTRGTMG